MTLQDFRKEKMQALKQHDEDTIKGLNVVISKLMLIEKSGNGEITDADVEQTLRKSLKELQEEHDCFEKAGRQTEVLSLKNQIAVVEKYLPKQLSEQEIMQIINGLPDKSVPTVMKHFKENYQGKVDMKLVSTLLKK